MAEFGEWNRKGGTLSDVTAEKEYGVAREFIVKGIQAGKLEYREGSIWGNPYLRACLKRDDSQGRERVHLEYEIEPSLPNRSDRTSVGLDQRSDTRGNARRKSKVA